MDFNGHMANTAYLDLARGLPGLSRSLLTRRLRQFKRAGLVERLGTQYVLTESGRGLEPIVFELGARGARRTFGEPDPDELDAQLLVWWMHTRLDTSGLPEKRQVFQIRFTDDRRPFWIVIESGVPSVCLTDPGFEVDVTILSNVRSLHQVWVGRLPPKEAVRSGRIRFEGSSALVRRMTAVLRLSPVPAIVAAAQTGVDSGPRARRMDSGDRWNDRRRSSIVSSLQAVVASVREPMRRFHGPDTRVRARIGDADGRRYAQRGRRFPGRRYIRGER
ncbi:MAG: winged helix-turn-helix transcriptional regulator [Acidithiobacillales bacterium]